MPEATKGWIFNIQKFSLHDGPGIRTTVFLKGCPLRCAWCANPESQSLLPLILGQAVDSRAYTVEEVTALCLQDRVFYEESGGGVTLSGGEPLSQPGFGRALVKALRKVSIHTAMETTGHAPPDLFEQGTEGVELLLYDIKHYDGEKHKEGTGVDNHWILENFRRSISSGRQVLPRIPMIPGYNDALRDAGAFSALLRGAGAKRVQLLPFHQLGEGKYTQLGRPYAMRGVKPLAPQALAAYRQAFADEGIDAFF